MDDNYTQKINIGARILDSARGNLYLAMRFMDIALCAFAYKSDEGRQMAGTDGNVYITVRIMSWTVMKRGAGMRTGFTCI